MHSRFRSASHFVRFVRSSTWSFRALVPHLVPPPVSPLTTMDDDSVRVLQELNDKLAVQRSIAQGASNFLSVFDPDPNDRKEDLRLQILQELTAADGNIAELLARIEDAQGESASSASKGRFPSSCRALSLSATGPASTQLRRNRSMGQDGYSEQAAEEAPDPRECFASSVPCMLLTPRVPTAIDSFGTTFDMILMMLQRLEELETAVEKIRSMDSIVAAVGRESRIKFELKLEDVLPR